MTIKTAQIKRQIAQGGQFQPLILLSSFESGYVKIAIEGLNMTQKEKTKFAFTLLYQAKCKVHFFARACVRKRKSFN